MTIALFVVGCSQALNETDYAAAAAKVGKAFSITYDANGATSGTVPVDSNYYTKGQLAKAADNSGDLARSDKLFSGWNTLPDGSGQGYRPGDRLGELTSNVTLYAMWHFLHVTYLATGATAGSPPVDSNEYPPGGGFTVLGPGTLSLAGHKLVGWHNQADTTGGMWGVNRNYVLQLADMVFEPIWAPAWTVEYSALDATSGTEPPSTSYALGESFVVADNPGSLTRDGFLFGGWSLSADGSNPVVTGSTHQEDGHNLIYFAIWLPTFTVTYHSNGADSDFPPINLNRYRPGTWVPLADQGNLSKLAYLFDGWSESSTGGVVHSVPGSIQMGSTNLQLWAVWLKACTVTYKPNGATGGYIPEDPNYRKAGTWFNVLDNTGSLVRGTDQFIGWSTQASGGTLVTPGQALQVTDPGVVLYAQWAPTFLLTYDANGATGGAVPPAARGNSNISVALASNPGHLIRAGWGLASWGTAADGTGEDFWGNFGIGLTQDRVFYAQWAKRVLAYATGLGSGNSSGLPRIAADPAGNAYCIDSTFDRILKISPSGSITTYLSSARARLLAWGQDGYLYINTTQGEFFRIDSGGQRTNVNPIGYSTVQPNGFVVDASSRIYCAPIYASGPVFSFPAGGSLVSGSGPYATCVALGSGGKVYFGTQSGQVYRQDAGGNVLIAGTGQNGTTGDGGSALSAQLRYVESLAVDSLGVVYASDNHVVRRVALDGNISTVGSLHGLFVSTIDPDSGAGNLAGLAVAPSGDLIVVDDLSQALGRITP